VTRILTLPTGPPPPDAPAAIVDEIGAALRGGQVVALPTDTVYGLAALPGVDGATAGLFALKGRSADVPLAVLCADADAALGLAAPGAVDDQVQRIAGRLWPGPLTLVLPRRPGLGYALGQPADTVGVRCPDHPLLLALAAAVGPIATTSANLHRQPTPATAAGVADVFGAELHLVVDGGPCSGIPSTVVEATGDGWRVLREGALALADIDAAATRD
jgi:L-threonylcarbamoyladenylate synthase